MTRCVAGGSCSLPTAAAPALQAGPASCPTPATIATITALSALQYFSSNRLCLLDRGWVFAMAHIRGGGEMGRQWWVRVTVRVGVSG